ncbi:MAG: CdaR family protein [Anaerolineae bacterium]|nr:CdaR family protein [Anaerolineae bacterium]MDW8071038.1 CdaR family protein [Anaerolineae bacterium]
MRKLPQTLSTFILSVILSLMVWFVAMREQNPPVEADYAPAIPIEIENLPPDTVIFGDVPDRVQLRLLAPQTSWDSIYPGKFRAWIDLSGLEPGLHEVPVQVQVSDTAISIRDKRPARVSVRLEPLLVTEVPIRIEVIDSPPVGYIARAPIFAPITTTVSGAAPQVSQVSYAAGEVYLRGAKDTVHRTVDLSARNPNGDVVTRITLNPAKVTVTVPVEQRFGYRDVSVRVRIKGEVASGYWISNITVSPSTVTVVGNPSALRELPGYVETLPVDVTNATANITERVALDLPQGISVVQAESGEGQILGGVQVTIQISAVEGGQTVQRAVQFQGLAEDLSAVARPAQVDVILSGPLPRLQSLTLQDVQVIANLFGLGVGTHQVKPTIVVPESLHVESIMPETVEVQISLRPSTPPPPYPTPTGVSVPR